MHYKTFVDVTRHSQTLTVILEFCLYVCTAVSEHKRKTS